MEETSGRRSSGISNRHAPIPRPGVVAISGQKTPFELFQHNPNRLNPRINMTHHSDKIVMDINQPEKHTHRCSRHPLVGDALDTTTLLAPLDEQNKLKMKSILSYYYSLNPALKTVFLDGILMNSCFNQLSYLDTKLPSILKIDFVMRLPTELSFKVLRYLDGKSLCHAAQVSHAWKAVADDDLLWYRMCSQHIDKKCTKCGWVSTSLTQGLPLMQKQKRRKTSDSSQVSRSDALSHSVSRTANTTQIARTPSTLVTQITRTPSTQQLLRSRIRSPVS